MKLVTYFKGHWQLALMTALIFVFWNYPVMYPFKILVVFLHEASHALMTLFTGGEVLELSLNPRQGGHVRARGGNGFLISTAGYLGSLLLGSLLFILALRSKADRIIVGVFGIIMLTLCAFYVRDSFALIFCIGGGIVALISARFFSQQINDLLLRLIGLSSMIYVPYDIFSDTLARSHLRSDARILAENYGGTTMMWGVLWMVISLIVIMCIVKAALKTPSNISFSSDKSVKNRHSVS